MGQINYFIQNMHNAIVKGNDYLDGQSMFG